MTQLTFTIDGTSCAACGIRIDDAVEAVPGVTRSQTSVRRRQTIVDFDPTTCEPDQIIAAVTAAGYTVTTTQR
jgi:copper chaperone